MLLRSGRSWPANRVLCEGQGIVLRQVNSISYDFKTCRAAASQQKYSQTRLHKMGQIIETIINTYIIILI